MQSAVDHLFYNRIAPDQNIFLLINILIFYEYYLSIPCILLSVCSTIYP